MPCKVVQLQSGDILFMCGPGASSGAPQKCWECHRPGISLCDWIGCDRPMCDFHRHNRGVEIDFCGEHVNGQA